MTMEQIEKFPVYSSIPEELVKNLLKSSEKNDFLIDSFKVTFVFVLKQLILGNKFDFHSQVFSARRIADVRTI